jgi:hypothetical protein
MTRQQLTRDAIYANLKAVEGMGQVFKSQRYVTDWEAFLNLYINDENLVKVCWFSLRNASERVDGVGEYGADNQANVSERSETYSIEFFYGFKDDTNEPSSFDFELICERIENRFRFLQNLNGTSFQTRAISRPFSGLWLVGSVLCHRAEFSLEVVHRIINPN